MATIQKRVDGEGKIHFRVQVRLKGYPAQSATFERKTDAHTWAASTESAIKEGRHFKTAEAKKHTVGEMIDKYIKDVLSEKKQKSRHSQEPRLLWWKGEIGSLSLANVTPATITEAKNTLAKSKLAKGARKGEKISDTTVIHYMAILSHCFNIAVNSWGWLQESPMRKVEKPKWPKGRCRYLSDEERNRLLEACRKSANPCLYDIVVLGLTTGMRKSELLGITWADVDVDRKTIILETTKNGDRRSAPLVGHALEVLRKRSKVRRIDSPFVFPAPYRPGRKPQPISIETAWRTAVKAAKLKDFHFHDLRHTCASFLAMNGATLAEIAEVLGHRTLAMVNRYKHISESHTSAVVSRMAAKMFATSEATADAK
ncbi:MAG: site-specific integrase [Candidatus Hydrogenedentes bacterium]|nr:site-specific integrase [Candidatus Hydrogenedentota bacterium]